ncbi:hypothetical protein K469DRAFT_691331 [Zopfia rhizophila CBS 207.26]|uniref:PSP1 C-terminal domain-containing protein n=1 Tax=Zopfia rhizophila CBS 207.26 TaxID=1314779 RepID=A0A6A6ES18_9PEZI|nr:hypothetical protein K469DRAFT_691331 [Zopfia rhizophila CBS 207.26]
MSYKGGLSAPGPSFGDKTKVQMRRPTPDSDVLASSDEDVTVAARPAPANHYAAGRRPSSGWLHDIQPNRKFSLPSVSFAGSQPTTPSLELPQQARPNTSAFPWNTTSFTAIQTDNRGTRLKEVVPSPTTVLPATEKALPSPTIPEVDDGIGFLLNQQSPIRKSVRSQSYSVGQQDIENSPAAQFSTRIRTSLRHRPSKPSLLGEPAVGLAQLREDDIDEVESSNGSEQGVRLPPGYWEREQQKQAERALLKQAAVENARARHRATSTGSPVSQHRRKTTQGLRHIPRTDSDFAIEEVDDTEASIEEPKMSLTRRFSEHVGGVARGPDVDHIVDSPKQQQWATPGMLIDNLSRRHSFATYGSHNQGFQLSTLSNTYEEDEDAGPSLPPSRSPANPDQFDAGEYTDFHYRHQFSYSTADEADARNNAAAYFAGYGPASRAINASAISAAHPDPVVSQTTTSSNPYAVPTVLGRPGRRLFVVAFKCSRADIYYLYDNTGLEIRRGDLVIVEGDRGCDLGQVTHADVSLEEAKKHKAEASDEHFRWLVMFSQYSLAGTANDSGMLGALARANGFPNTNRANLTGMGAQQDQDAKPKMIKRLAQQHEIMGLRDKEGQEAKAKRIGAQKAAEHKLPMEILDAEYQADYHKLTYFYYAEAYVNFNDLVTDLFKQYKVRIWMSAVNPASVVNPAGLMQVPPPSAIGPGAILPSHSPNASLPVGPGFGNASYRGNEQYGRTGTSAPHGNYDEAYYPFAHQLPYTSQAQYGMPGWGQGQQGGHEIYGRYGTYPVGYPNVTASGTPMNYGAYYPPATYSSSPAFNASVSGPAYRGGYPATSSVAMSYGASHSGVSTAGPSYGGNQSATYTSGMGYPNAYTTAPTSGVNYGTAYTNTSTAYGNGFTTATTSAAYTSSYDPSLLMAMQNLSFGK